jgi:hypothetical protein
LGQSEHPPVPVQSNRIRGRPVCLSRHRKRTLPGVPESDGGLRHSLFFVRRRAELSGPPAIGRLPITSDGCAGAVPLCPGRHRQCAAVSLHAHLLARHPILVSRTNGGLPEALFQRVALHRPDPGHLLSLFPDAAAGISPLPHLFRQSAVPVYRTRIGPDGALCRHTLHHLCGTVPVRPRPGPPVDKRRAHAAPDSLRARSGVGVAGSGKNRSTTGITPRSARHDFHPASPGKNYSASTSATLLSCCSRWGGPGHG